MPGCARAEIVSDTEVGAYHCTSRCVRRAFLCGDDPYTGKNYDHRKGWVQDRLEFLAAVFGVEVLGFSIMDNHIHSVLRTRPDVVSTWTDEEIALRWWRLFPKRRGDDGLAAQPQEHELQMLQSDEKKLAELRRRLGNLSWFMRCLNENIARRANKEDGVTGRFWEGRFKCQKLLDDAAILACSVYVDLNPIRANIAETPEDSEFTSAYERINARHEKEEKSRSKEQRGEKRDRQGESAPRDGWLAVVNLDDVPAADDQPVAERRRASDKGFLRMSLDDYLELLDWTGRQVRSDKRGAIPGHLAPILERLHLSGDHWLDTISNFGRWFRRAAGRVGNLRQHAGTCGRQFLHGVARCQQAFT